jgi:predicted phage gp36 major capsid-like protein
LCVYDFNGLIALPNIELSTKIRQVFLSWNGRAGAHRVRGQSASDRSAGFFAWFRTGSDVLVDNAFRMLNVATTA